MVSTKTFELAGDMLFLGATLNISEVTEKNHERVKKMMLFLSSKMSNEEETETTLDDVLDYLEKKYL